MCQILPVKAVRISENRGSFFERDTVLFEIADGLPDVPGKHLLYIHELRWFSHYFLERLSDALSGWRRCRRRRRGGGELGAQTAASACSRVCGASTAKPPVAVGVGGAERGAPMSQSAYRRVRVAATPKGAAQRGCSATGPTPRATGSRPGGAAR